MATCNDLTDARRRFAESVHHVYFGTTFTIVPASPSANAISMKFIRYLDREERREIGRDFTELLAQHGISLLSPLIDDHGDTPGFAPVTGRRGHALLQALISRDHRFIGTTLARGLDEDYLQIRKEKQLSGTLQLNSLLRSAPAPVIAFGVR
jgi:hypothetical protein